MVETSTLTDRHLTALDILRSGCLSHIPDCEFRSRRTWKPNVQKMTLYSETLGKVQLKVTTHALR